MKRPRFISLRANIIAVVVLASSLAVGVFTSLISYVNMRGSIAQLDNQLSTLADVVGQNSTAAIDFSDKKAAAEVLGAMRREPPVVSACLYDKRDFLFSEYQRDAGVKPCPKLAGAQQPLAGDYRYVSRSIRRATDYVGSIELTADMRDVNTRNLHLFAIAILVALGSLTMAGISGALLQRRISRPVIQLAQAMKRVTTDGTFEARVRVEGVQEIAQLASGFNQMITELERRNHIARIAESQLLEQARTDALTGLPNRRYLGELLERELTRLHREKWMVGLLYIDLDGFKLVNDSLGHSVGDLLLCEVAKRLRSRVRSMDTLARVGGDEFTVILTGLETESDAAVAANGLIQSLSRPFVIEGHEITVGASIGISTQHPLGADDPDLLKQADSAMYAAKRSGKNRAVHFSPELSVMARERLTLESELRGAIGRGEIYVEYQPEFDMASGRLVRFEALARWQHATLGDISPSTFIPVAEESGLIYGLGEYVMEIACMECLKWQEMSPFPIQVAVNMSALQFNSAVIVHEVGAVLQRTGLDPALLQIELTESVMIGSLTQSAEKMWSLRSLGVTLAIDDFGTGYSCLGYLPELPFSSLKIDRTFVRNLETSSEVATMIRTMIELGKKMGLHVVAEGIETESQFAVVLEMGADEVQGFLLGRPSPAPRVQFAEYIAAIGNPRKGGFSALTGPVPQVESPAKFDVAKEWWN
jgi:diguanylate cyclase (GGDEF)-like protein